MSYNKSSSYNCSCKRYFDNYLTNFDWIHELRSLSFFTYFEFNRISSWIYPSFMNFYFECSDSNYLIYSIFWSRNQIYYWSHHSYLCYSLYRSLSSKSKNSFKNTFFACKYYICDFDFFRKIILNSLTFTLNKFILLHCLNTFRYW